MAFKYNPLTGQLDMVSSAPISSDIGRIVRAILLDKYETPLPDSQLIQIIFDEDSILYNDDEAL